MIWIILLMFKSVTPLQQTTEAIPSQTPEAPEDPYEYDYNPEIDLAKDKPPDGPPPLPPLLPPQPSPIPLIPILVPEIQVRPVNYFCQKDAGSVISKPQGCPSCIANCGSVTFLQMNKGPKRLCSCDKLCHFYNDCCEDFPTACPVIYKEAEKLALKLTTDDLTCKNIRAYDSSIYHFDMPLVTRCEGAICSKDYKWNLKDVNFNEDIPVTDTETGIHYANWHCAKCAGVTHFIPWTVRVHAFAMETDDIQNNITVIRHFDEIQAILDSSDFLGSQISLEPPEGNNVRECVPPQVLHNTCSEDCNMNLELVTLCENGSHIITGHDAFLGAAFKNYYCALCSWNENLPSYINNFEEMIKCGSYMNMIMQGSTLGNKMWHLELKSDPMTGIYLEDFPHFCHNTTQESLIEIDSCPTCEGMCGHVVSRIQTGNSFCSCDELCYFYNDCCPGFESQCPEQFAKSKNITNDLNVHNHKTECISFRNSENSQFRTPMIKQCPNAQPCVREITLMGDLDFNYFVPVTDQDTGIHYASWECAMCNGISLSSVRPWSFYIDYNKMLDNEKPYDFQSETKITTRQKLYLSLNDINPGPPGLGYSFSPPKEYQFRDCLLKENVVESCSQECRDNSELIDMCENEPTVYSAINVGTGDTYRNVYCALCSWTPDIPAYIHSKNVKCGVMGSRYMIAYPPMGNKIAEVVLELDANDGLVLREEFCKAEPRPGTIPEPRGCPSCLGICGTVTTHKGRRNLGENSYCSCDPLCLFYNDCCDRFRLYCPKEWKSGVEILGNIEISNERVECMTYPVSENGLSSGWDGDIFMMATCDPKISKNKTCLDLQYHGIPPKIKIHEKMDRYVPVTDRKTGINYASLECARCNGATDPIPWKVIVNRGGLRAAQDTGRHANIMDEHGQRMGNESDLQAIFKMNSEESKQFFISFSPLNISNVRYCYKDIARPVIRKCPTSCKNKDLINLCENGPLMYTTKNNPRGLRDDKSNYKNYFCALCNSGKGDTLFNTNDIRCGEFYTPWEGNKIFGHISLTLVFDFDTSDGLVVGKQRASGSSKSSDNEHIDILGIITLFCISISMVCLLIRLFLHNLVPHFWTLAGKMQLQLTIAFFLAFLFLLLGALTTKFYSVCYFCAVAQNFGFLAAFSWMTAIAFESWKAFGPKAHLYRPGDNEMGILRICIITWSTPAIFTAITITFDFTDIDDTFKPTFADELCWYGQRYALLIYFGIPVAVSIIINTVLFTITSIELNIALRKSRAMSKQDRKNVSIYIRLFSLMGITWILGFISPFIDHIVADVIFVVMNSLQGLFLFVAFVCQRKVWQQLSKAKERPTSASTSNSSNSRTNQITETTNLRKQSTGSAIVNLKKQNEDTLTHI